MAVIVHFLNGNDISIENHYAQKEYRNDILVEIDKVFFEVYFFTAGVLEYEMRNDGFFSLPGLIILDEISTGKIYNSIEKLFHIGYFKRLTGTEEDFVANRFINEWYEDKSAFLNSVIKSSYRLL
jgi:hypothetical protein